MFRGMMILGLLLSIVGFIQGATIYVPDDYPTIQSAIDAAATNDTIIVRPGTYYENIDFLGKVITVRSESGPMSTVIDGNQAGSVVAFQNGECCYAVLDGFTLTNGCGGIFCSPATSPTITNNVITANTATYGGGIFCDEYSFPTITNNIILGNTAGQGGGISLLYSRHLSPVVTNNIITANTASWVGGGGIAVEKSSALIMNNTISGNTAGDEGGGIWCWGCDSEYITVITNNIITGNSADYGGGILSTYYSETILTNNIISGNSANQGGGIHCDSFSTLTDNTIVGNTAIYYGGGVYLDAGSFTTITNNTITANTASSEGGGIYCYYSGPSIINTILWDNSAPTGKEIAVSYYSIVNICYSDVEGSQSSCYVETGCTLNWGAGMIDADPLFVDSANNDFHLTLQSPCKDTGDNTAVTELYDFEGDPRIAGNTVDMGADEFYYHLYHIGDVIPGGSIDMKVVGPPSAPVMLALGAGIVDPPRVTPYGDLYLAFPLMQFKIGSIPSSNGVLVRPSTVPLFWNTGEEKPLQALVGPLGNPNSVLTNLLTLTVE